MKRRVGIAQALLGEPKLLIVDEPTAGLDPEERVRLRNLLAEMSARCTVILSTHIIEDVSQSCRDLAVIRAGQIVFRGHPRELVGRARGHTWRLSVPAGERPPKELLLVSTLPLEGSDTEYRVLGDLPPGARAEAAEPSLEDGYLWLMRP
jgi:ABC-2 type transport system ATP-binding protein